MVSACEYDLPLLVVLVAEYQSCRHQKSTSRCHKYRHLVGSADACLPIDWGLHTCNVPAAAIFASVLAHSACVGCIAQHAAARVSLMTNNFMALDGFGCVGRGFFVLTGIASVYTGVPVFEMVFQAM